MAWGWGQWKGSSRSSPKGKNGKGQQWKDRSAQPHIVGYDGKRLQLSSPASAGGGGKADAAETSIEKQLKVLKSVVSAMTKDTQLPTEIKEALAEVETTDRDTQIKERQKELNSERKRFTKIRMLQQQLEREQEDFQQWKMRQKELIRKEEQRHQSKLEEIQEKLNKAQAEAEGKEQEGESYMDDVDSEKELMPDKEQQKGRINELERQMSEMAKSNAEIEEKFHQACHMYQTMQKMNAEKEEELQRYKALIQQHQQTTAGGLTGPAVQSPQRPLPVTQDLKNELKKEDKKHAISQEKNKEEPAKRQNRERSPRGSRLAEDPKPKAFQRRPEGQKTQQVPSSPEGEKEEGK